MLEGRKAIPAELRRRVLLEAGHRCAIQTCLQTTMEIAHIKPWKEVKEHSFDNLIALCPNCHSRYDKQEIDRKSMLQYKANLSILNSRYCEAERRILRYFYNNPKVNGIRLESGFDVHLMNALEDSLLERFLTSGIKFNGIPSHIDYVITDKGRNFVSKLFSGERLI